MRHSGRLTMAGAEYRFLSPGGEELESGNAQAEVTSGTLVITPDDGASLAVPFGKIASVSEPQAYTIAVTLSDGHVIELARLGVMRTQLLAELRDARAGEAAQAAGAVGTAEAFPGWVGSAFPGGDPQATAPRATGTGAVEMSLVCAGHPLPLLLRAGVAGDEDT
jgi:hypothetical protein